MIKLSDVLGMTVELVEVPYSLLWFERRVLAACREVAVEAARKAVAEVPTPELEARRRVMKKIAFMDIYSFPPREGAQSRLVDFEAVTRELLARRGAKEQVEVNGEKMLLLVVEKAS